MLQRSSASEKVESFLKCNEGMPFDIAHKSGIRYSGEEIESAAQKAGFDAVRNLNFRKGVQAANVFYIYLKHKRLKEAKTDATSLFCTRKFQKSRGKAKIKEKQECTSCGAIAFTLSMDNRLMCACCGEKQFPLGKFISFVSMEKTAGEGEGEGQTLHDTLASHEVSLEQTLDSEDPLAYAIDADENLISSTAPVDYLSNSYSLRGDIVLTATLLGFISAEGMKLINLIYTHVSHNISDMDEICRAMDCDRKMLLVKVRAVRKEITNAGVSAYRGICRNGKNEKEGNMKKKSTTTDQCYVVWSQTPEDAQKIISSFGQALDIYDIAEAEETLCL